MKSAKEQFNNEEVAPQGRRLLNLPALAYISPDL